MILDGKEEICKYIPQRDPIVMVDKLISLDETACETGLLIVADNAFVSGGALQDGAVIEHTAQSAALHIGYKAVMKSEPVKIGMIGSVSRFKINRLPKVGEEIRTTIAVEASIGIVVMVGATVRVGDEVIAEGKLKLATP